MSHKNCFQVDSGGPYVLENAGSLELVGISSGFLTARVSENISVFILADISSYRDWIDAQTKMKTRKANRAMVPNVSKSIITFVSVWMLL